MYSKVKLTIDIETLPAPETKRTEIIQILNSRKKKKNGTADLTEEELFRNTSFDGAFGRLFCIGYIKEDDTGILEKDVIKSDGTALAEKEALKRFWELASGVNLFIGHNIMEFDLPFIYKRSIIFNVKPTRDISFVRYRNEPIYDTLKEWDKWAFGNPHKLDTLAKALSLPTSKEVMDGSQVYDYYLADRLEEIYLYCMDDVELTRKVYYKMNFQALPA